MGRKHTHNSIIRAKIKPLSLSSRAKILQKATVALLHFFLDDLHSRVMLLCTGHCLCVDVSLAKYLFVVEQTLTTDDQDKESMTIWEFIILREYCMVDLSREDVVRPTWSL